MPKATPKRAARKTKAVATGSPKKAAPKKAASSKKAAKRSSIRSAKPAASTPAKRVRMAKADGDAPVQAFIAALPDWQKDLAHRIDGLIVREVPHVRKAVKWNSAMYGVEGQGWFAAMAGFRAHLKVSFFKGTSLRPVPPSGESKDMRAIDVREADAFDDDRFAKWVRQAAAIPGWGS